MSGRYNAVGMAEFSTIAIGMSATDRAVKNQKLVLLKSGMICPGRFLLVFGGSHASVQSAVQQIEAHYGAYLAGSCVIGNLSAGVLEAVAHCVDCTGAQALGVLETADAVSAIAVADECVKTAQVAVAQLRLAQGIGGKGVVVIAGGVAEISAAVLRAAEGAERQGKLIAHTVISNPAEQTLQSILKET